MGDAGSRPLGLRRGWSHRNTLLDPSHVLSYQISSL